MAMKKSFKNFLENTSLHGFLYLADGAVISRLSWSILIVLAFTTSIVIIVRGVADDDKDPFVTTVKHIPVQKIPFPAISFYPQKQQWVDPDKQLARNLVKRALINVDWDCSLKETWEDCPRTDTHPIIDKAMGREAEKVFWHFYNFVKNESNVNLGSLCVKSGTNIPLQEHFTRLDPFFEDAHLYVKGIEQVLINDNASGTNGACSNLNLLIQEVFRIPRQELKKKLGVYIKTNGVTVPETLPDCKGEEIDKHIVACLTAFIHAQGSIQPQVRLTEQVTSTFFRHLQQENSSLIDDFTEDLFEPCNVNDNEDENYDIGMQYRQCLKQVKYNRLPHSYRIEEAADVRDIDMVLDFFELPSMKVKVADKAIVESDGTFICGKRSRVDSQTQYWMQGLVYSINANPLMKSNSYSEVFYEEMVKRITHEKIACPTMWIPPANGPDYSYFAILDTSHDHVMMALHYPSKLLESGAEFVSLKSGHTYTIGVVPSGKKVNDDVAALSIDKRNCMLPKDKHNLAVFGEYSQSNCIVECKWRRAAEACNCVPLQFPREINSTAPICMTSESSLCFTTEMSLTNPSTQCNCKGDCNSFEYDLKVTDGVNNFFEVCGNGNFDGSSLWSILFPNKTKNDFDYFLKEDMYLTRAVFRRYEVNLCERLMEDVTVVQVFVMPATGFVVEKGLRLTFIDKIANVGKLYVISKCNLIMYSRSSHYFFQVVLWACSQG